MADEHLKTEVAIVGAGLVGLAAAVAMHQAGHAVVIIDRNQALGKKNNKKHSVSWDARIYAISPNNVAWLARLGVWQQLDQSRISPMKEMALWGDGTVEPLTLIADDIHADGLGFIVEAGRLMDALLATLQGLAIKTLFGVECESIVTAADSTQITLREKKAGVKTVTADLLLAADSSQSWIRNQLNFAVKQQPYAHVGVVANFKAEKSHDDIARQWFKPNSAEGLEVLAWLPLPDDHISIVWSVPPLVANDLMALAPQAFSQMVAVAGDHRLGDLALVTAPASFPLSLTTVPKPVQGTTILLGDAAHQVHPMAGQGVNLGFRDVVSLLDVLARKGTYQTINDGQLLRQYERERKVDVSKMVLLTDGLYQLFNNQSTTVKKVRRWGFEATKRQYLKDLLVKQAINM